MQEVVWSRKRTIEKRFYFGCFIHESYTNFLKICIFAVARADTKSAKKRMVVRFFERRIQCVKYGEMGVIVPVVSTKKPAILVFAGFFIFRTRILHEFWGMCGMVLSFYFVEDRK